MKMYEVKEYSKEKVILVTVSLREDVKKGWSAEDSYAEFKELAISSGVDIIDEVLVKIDKPTPNYFIGSGKATEIHQLVDGHGKDVKAVLFSEELSSTQQRNLEKALGIKIIDRTQLILDVFSQRAHTNEGKLQVELAQLEYLLPRLSGLGVKLSRLGGGIGTRGPGEKMLETDRRGVRRRIKYIKSDLAGLSLRRNKMRQNRTEHSVATVAVIGYTNAGKSTLLNQLTKSNVEADNRLFSTLDLTSRQYLLPNKQKILFIDTVGFIHKLPHDLVEAFKATLEEVKEADLLLHILDISNPKANEHLDAVYEVLKELGAESKPTITALNKIDKIDNHYTIERFLNKIQDSVAISALKEKEIKDLINLIADRITPQVEIVESFITHQNMSLLNKIYSEGRVLERRDTPEGIHVKAVVPTHLKHKLK